MIRKIQIGVVVYLLFATSAVGLSVGMKDPPTCPISNGKNTAVIESSWGTCIESKFNTERVRLSLSVQTKSLNSKQHAGIVVRVDGQRVKKFLFNLSAQETWHKNLDLRNTLDISEKNHTIIISTYGNRTQFNFTRDIDTSETNIPAPRIKNVSISNGKIEGEPSSVAYVTVTNPSEQLYSSKLIVHTQKTDGSLYLASVPPGESETFKVELLDSRGAKIVGEARLYTENLTDDDGALDQVGFVGQADGTTSAWNESFEPVRPPWMQDHYRYENDSHSKSFSEKVSGGQKVAGVPVVYPIVAALFGIFFVRRLR